MARAWLIDSRTIARKVKNPARACADQIKGYGANRDCPNCHHLIDNSDVSHDWPGFPAGVKFDPSDAELLEHLAAKCGIGASKPHAFIDEFIPTLVHDQGICYAHPEKLPGVKKDGSSVHFFHRTINAYATGQRKRRKVHNEDGPSEEHVRWHKTGKTKPVTENGMQKGCKKIMVLYKSSKKGMKPDKCNWVMHQYHLGTDEDEKEGEYVVSKIIYQQQKQIESHDDIPLAEYCDLSALQTSPRTPNPPNPPRPGTSHICDDDADDNILQSSFLEQKVTVKGEADVPAHAVHPEVYAAQPENDAGYAEWLAGESQAVEDTDFCGIDGSLLREETLDSSSLFLNNFGQANPSYTSISNTSEMAAINNAPYGIAELANLELDTPPDFSCDLQFNSQDSWIGRF
ncbi:NAC domain-containing protein 73-like [Mercurialis annua]|uniref:NAC domain-containing protein 73-like n=1 Tax=Mercurialis annua TaxID=3986 RepID=UPI00215EF21F|nr:NAC domain-containing protein 73-like [Mercurialis annua]